MTTATLPALRPDRSQPLAQESSGSGFTGPTQGRAAVAGAVVAGECLVFVANGFRCPLSDLAESLGTEHGSVSDLYLPAWFARNMPAIHVPLLLLVY